MAIPFLIGAGAGLVSAALFASAATGHALAGILFYLAPLPICLAGLGWGWMAAAVAALAGTVVVGGVLGLAPGAIFAGAIAMPMAVLVLSRPALPPGRGAARPSHQLRLEWYPIGRLRRLGRDDRRRARRHHGADAWLRRRHLSRLDQGASPAQRA